MTKRTQALLAGSVAAFLLTGAIYSFYPIRHSFTSKIGYWTSYSAGWLEAGRVYSSGKLSYSFDQYLIEGLANYAHENQKIGPVAVPSTERWESRFIDGFKRRMESKISKQIGLDFPEGYVREYLEKGWLDFTQAQPSTCPIHHRKMDVATLPIEIVYPFTIAREKFAWELAAEKQFPFPSTVKLDAALLRRPRNARVRICPDCTDAEVRWWTANKSKI